MTLFTSCLGLQMNLISLSITKYFSSRSWNRVRDTNETTFLCPIAWKRTLRRRPYRSSSWLPSGAPLKTLIIFALVQKCKWFGCNPIYKHFDIRCNAYLSSKSVIWTPPQSLVYVIHRCGTVRRLPSPTEINLCVCLSACRQSVRYHLRLWSCVTNG